MFALQYMTRPGTGYGGYVVNDGSNTVFIKATTPSDRGTLYRWLGNGDMAKGRDMANSPACFSMPDVSLNPAQYNAIVNPMPIHSACAYSGKGD